jgi:hypothetical protein
MARDLQIHWKVSFLSFNLNILESLKKQNGSQMSQVFFRIRAFISRWFLRFKNSIAKPPRPTGAAPNAILIPLHITGLRRGLASSYLSKFE